MRLKEDLSDWSDSVRFVRFAGLLDLSDVRFVNFRDLKKRETDHGPRTTDHGRTDGRTDRPSYRDAWTHL